jgi:nucleotide-binding universal stress UspA family protein
VVPDIQRILYATDLSENARYAFGYALSLAQRYEARITVLHILEELSPTALLLIGDIIGEKRWSSLEQEKVDTLVSAMKTRLQTFCQDYIRDVPHCSLTVDDIVVKTGQPVDKIIETAEKKECDVIVMGSRGQGMLAEVMIGSTSRRVLRRCKKPVLVVRLPEVKERPPSEP